MSVQLDELYFEWLYGQINPIHQKNKARTYWKMFRVMYRTPFVWFVANDDNRAGDGQDLRREWLESVGEDVDQTDQLWLVMECSFLEMLIALSRRAAFLTSEDPVKWFWEMMENIKLRHYNDAHMVPENRIELILRTVVERTYQPSGHGGLFPCPTIRYDMRQMELWYQLQHYILEKGRL